MRINICSRNYTLFSVLCPSAASLLSDHIRDDKRKEKLHCQKFKKLLLICQLKNTRKRNTIWYKVMMTSLWCDKRLLRTVKCHIRHSDKTGLITLCKLTWQINPTLFVSEIIIVVFSGTLSRLTLINIKLTRTQTRNTAYVYCFSSPIPREW